MNRLNKTWAETRSTVNGWLMLPSAVSAEAMAVHGWDSLTIDMQHGLIGYSEMLGILSAIDRTQVVPLVRVPSLESGIIGKVLDAGALGVICPMINTAQQAAALVRAMRYAPQGGRSFGPVRPVMRYGPGYVASANEECLAIAQIETAEALRNLESILAVDGLDVAYVGPSDLALDMGYTPAFDTEEPALLAAFEQIVETANRHGVVAAMHCGSPAYARRMSEMGFRFVTIGSDVGFLLESAARSLQEFRGSDEQGKSFY